MADSLLPTPGALAIMTRSTSDPRIKAGLEPRIPTATGRRDLALAFIDDLVERAAALPDVRVRLAVTPPVEGLRVARPALPGETFLAQRGRSLAERQRHVFQDLAASGFRRVVVMGSDLPDLPGDYLARAFATLGDSSSTVVLGPTESGGCYLMGATVAPGGVPDVFSNVSWQSAHAIDELARACLDAGLEVSRLDVWTDVDNPDDLDRLVARLRASPRSAPHTSAVLRKLRLL